jgi:hypothetical protein
MNHSQKDRCGECYDECRAVEHLGHVNACNVIALVPYHVNMAQVDQTNLERSLYSIPGKQQQRRKLARMTRELEG